MPKYTTGEIAKLCGVSVRTVQYYDTRALLIPSELTEGGRRLYTQEDVKKLQLICFLRGIGLGIDSICGIFAQEDPGSVIFLLLQQQKQLLQSQIDEKRETLTTVEQLMQELKLLPQISVESMGDIALTMTNQSKLRKVHRTMLLIGIGMDLLQIATILLWIFQGIWLPFAICLPFVLLGGVYMTKLYYEQTAYICPQCHAVFKPTLRQFLFSAHTPKTRKLTCTACGHHGYCVETHAEKK